MKALQAESLHRLPTHTQRSEPPVMLHKPQDEWMWNLAAWTIEAFILSCSVMLCLTAQKRLQQRHLCWDLIYHNLLPLDHSVCGGSVYVENLSWCKYYHLCYGNETSPQAFNCNFLALEVNYFDSATVPACHNSAPLQCSNTAQCRSYTQNLAEGNVTAAWDDDGHVFGKLWLSWIQAFAERYIRFIICFIQQYLNMFNHTSWCFYQITFRM